MENIKTEGGSYLPFYSVPVGEVFKSHVTEILYMKTKLKAGMNVVNLRTGELSSLDKETTCVVAKEMVLRF